MALPFTPLYVLVGFKYEIKSIQRQKKVFLDSGGVVAMG